MRPLGMSGLEVSPIVLGAMLRHSQGIHGHAAIVQAAVDAGSTTIDTAPLYGFGDSERALGRAIAGRRQCVQILTKVGLRWDDAHGDVLFEFWNGRSMQAVRKNSRPESIRLEIERSLARLGIETIDLVQVHHLDRHVAIAESIGALKELRAEGKLRAIGVSNYSQPEIVEAEAALGDVPLASVQLRYNHPSLRTQRSKVHRPPRTVAIGQYVADNPRGDHCYAVRVDSGGRDPGSPVRRSSSLAASIVDPSLIRIYCGGRAPIRERVYRATRGNGGRFSTISARGQGPPDRA